ncbi:Unconventional myosin-XVB [Frankliniella fusca]|uniref:Unconventional myosin-XVB n=1 Tax=Frankliniella fusca TaxID=407009 RepID=A0AAE1I4F3_9NEOP|nr:Unconventional myosin-XVB [Frankliniella fusca]
MGYRHVAWQVGGCVKVESWSICEQVRGWLVHWLRLDVPPRAFRYQDGPSLDELRQHPRGETQDKTRSWLTSLLHADLVSLRFHQQSWKLGKLALNHPQEDPECFLGNLCKN